MYKQISKIYAIFITFIIIGVSLSGVAYSSSLNKLEHINLSDKTRKFELEYNVTVKDLPKYRKHVNVWIPLPPDTSYQHITGKEIITSVPYVVKYDSELGNPMIFLEIPNDRTTFNFKMVLSVERNEDQHDISLIKENGEVDQVLYAKYLDPSRQAVQDERVKRYSKIAVGKEKTVLGKARGIYNFILDNMDYNKKEPGYGDGNVNRLCVAIDGGKNGKGNCTDYHSFFGSLMRMQNIPVKLTMGFPLKPYHNEEKGINGGYHCWAEFYVPSFGWLPVDISEADKDPSKKEYYFGSIDENRIAFSKGRDITLVPPQKGESLNFFGPDPYIEVDGKPFNDFTRTIKYRDIQ